MDKLFKSSEKSIISTQPKLFYNATKDGRLPSETNKLKINLGNKSLRISRSVALDKLSQTQYTHLKQNNN